MAIKIMPHHVAYHAGLFPARHKDGDAAFGWVDAAFNDPLAALNRYARTIPSGIRSSTPLMSKATASAQNA
jgi:hypothetical protein